MINVKNVQESRQEKGDTLFAIHHMEMSFSERGLGLFRNVSCHEVTQLLSFHYRNFQFSIVSRWSSGSRGRATSAREVIEVAGSNHAIGVILNLAWGPNNFSPSMIWSWRTRGNSQTGLGAE